MKPPAYYKLVINASRFMKEHDFGKQSANASLLRTHAVVVIFFRIETINDD